MTGKASLIMILGFSLIFLVMGYFWGDLATRSVDNHTSYYKGTIAHNIAVSGANIALRNLLQDTNWTTGISNRSFENGKMNVTVSAVPMYRHIISTGTFMGVDRIVEVKIGRSTWAKYAWLIQSVSTGSKTNRPWITGDTIYGGFHSNQYLLIDGNPVFYGKVSVENGLKMTPGSNPQFLGGFVTGVTVPKAGEVNVGSYKTIAQDEQTNNAGAQCYFTKDTWLTFNGDGTVSYRTALVNNHGGDSSKFSAPITIPLSTMAPEKLIYVRGNLYMSGTLNGQVTIACDGSSGFGGEGNVYFVGDMVYKTDPMIEINPHEYVPNNSCTDLLGVVAANNFVIATTAASGGQKNNVTDQDIRLDGGFISAGGGVHMEDLTTTWKTTPTGSIYLRGSMTAGKEEIVAIYNGNTLIAGYNRHVVLDERFLVKPPLWFPYSSSFEVLSWLE